METEKRFKDLKEVILKRAKMASACKGQYGRAYRSETLAELMQVVKDNFHWACDSKVVTPLLVEIYREEFAGNDIFLDVDVESGFLLCGNASVEASGNASVEAYGNASVEAYGNASVKAYDNASVEAYNNASVKAYDNAYISSWRKIKCKLHDNAIHRVESEDTIYHASDKLKFVKV